MSQLRVVMCRFEDDEAAAFALMDAYVAAGGTFIDTADIYSFWAEGNPGVSGQIIGRWLHERSNRQRHCPGDDGVGRLGQGANGAGLARRLGSDRRRMLRGDIEAPQRTQRTSPGARRVHCH